MTHTVKLSLYVIRHHIVKTHGEYEKMYISVMQVCGGVNASASLPLVKEPLVPTE
jgi:hypothetical protein